MFSVIFEGALLRPEITSGIPGADLTSGIVKPLKKSELGKLF